MSPPKPTILISRILPEQALDMARAKAEVDYFAHDRPMPRAELLTRLKGRQGLICVISEVINEELLAACPELRVVSNVAVGYNKVDVAAATRRGVVITNTPDVLTDTTADFAWTLLMSAARRLAEADRFVRDGKWKQWEMMLLLGGDVHGKTLGIVGFGRIGRAMARRALGFNMRVLYQDAVAADAAAERELRATRVDLPTLLRESDFVTLHTPLIPETRHLINAQSLKTMKKTAYLINASRGPVVDEAALAQALKEGWIAGARAAPAGIRRPPGRARRPGGVAPAPAPLPSPRARPGNPAGGARRPWRSPPTAADRSRTASVPLLPRAAGLHPTARGAFPARPDAAAGARVPGSRGRARAPCGSRPAHARDGRPRAADPCRPALRDADRAPARARARRPPSPPAPRATGCRDGCDRIPG